MNAAIRTLVLSLLLAPPAVVQAAGIDTQIERLAGEARAADPAFSAFSLERGAELHQRAFAGGKPDTPACATCHGKDPRQAGQTRTGKRIDAMASSVSPARYGDSEKVEKWFKRNCQEVLGRACTAQEKGDWLAYMRSR